MPSQPSFEPWSAGGEFGRRRGAGPLPYYWRLTPQESAPVFGKVIASMARTALIIAQLYPDVVAQLGQDHLVVPLVGAHEELDGLVGNAGLDGDQPTDLAPKAAVQPAEDEGGVGPLLGAVEARQVAIEDRGDRS